MNLNKFINTDFSIISSAVIAASEENSALVNYLENLVSLRLGKRYTKKTYAADRYFSVQQILDELSATSLFGDANLFIIRFKTKPSVEQAKLVQEAFALTNQDNFILLVCDKLDKKDTTAAWLVAADLSVTLVGDQDEARAWALHKFDSVGVQIEHEALELLLTININRFFIRMKFKQI